jgi:mono/diheme cytochrome c family protein
MRKSRVWIAVAVVVLAAQLVPVDRSNPPVEAEIALPDAVRGIVHKACYDCHSHETRWPWYAYVAPVSWLVHHDVEHAREHLNFSRWGAYDAKEQGELFEEIAEEVEKREMPLQIYVSLHSEARLTSAERRTLIDWAEAQESALPTE